jgi:uncharacterized protein related to proFAR isomerase
MVTNNRADYRALYERRDLHSGLVVVISNVRRERQRQLFSAALDYLDEAGEPINQVLEIDFENDEVVINVFDLPTGNF